MLIACQDLPGSPPFAPEPPLKNICLPCFPEEGPHQPAAKPRGLPQRGEGARLGEDLPVLGLSFSRQLPPPPHILKLLGEQPGITLLRWPLARAGDGSQAQR